MPPKKPLYESPLLAILRGGKQAVQQPTFGIPQKPTTIPSTTFNTAQTTTPTAANLAPIQAPQAPIQRPPINPLDIIQRGKDGVDWIAQAPPRGLVTGAIQDIPKGLDALGKQVGRDPIGSAKTVGKFAFNIPNYIMAGFVATGRSLLEETAPRVFPGITRESIRDDFDSAANIDEWLLKGKVDTWQQVYDKVDEAVKDSPNAKPWEKTYLAGTVAILGFAADASGIGGGTSSKIPKTAIQQLVLTRDIDTAIKTMKDAGVPQEVIERAAPLVVRANNVEQVQNAFVRASEDALNEIDKKIVVPQGSELRKDALSSQEIKVAEDFIDFQRGLNLTKEFEPKELRSQAERIADKFGFTEKGPALANKFDEILSESIPNRPGAMDIKPVNRSAEILPSAKAEPPFNPKLEAFRSGKPSTQGGYIANPLGQSPTPRIDSQDVSLPKSIAPKQSPRIKIDSEISEIRKALQVQDATKQTIGEIETRLSILEDSIPDVKILRQVAGKQLTNGDTLSQVQATAQKLISKSDFLKGISKVEAETILSAPSSYSSKQVTGARIVRRANLDDLAAEYGYRDLDEAGEAVVQFDRLRDEVKDFKDILRTAKGDRTLANKVKRLVNTATTERRSFVKELRDQFNLVDSDVRKATQGRDFLTLSESGFDDFVKRLEQVAVERADTTQAKIELMDLLERRNFVREENYRRVAGYPPVSQMNADQMREYAKVMEQYQTGDVFLTERQLEVVDRGSLAGIKTMREAKERLLTEIRKKPGMENIKLEDLNVTPTVIDRMSYDTALAEKNPFYNFLVNRTHEHAIAGEAHYLDVQAKVLDLAEKAKASRSRGFTGSVRQSFVPKHEEIIQYLEAPLDNKEAFAKALTKEELDYANYVQQYYTEAYEHLVKIKELYGSRYVDAYFTHIRRDFLEAWTDDGFVKAVKEWWQSQKESQMIADIIDQDTGNILPKSKFFQYTMQRTGEITPSKNLTRVFLQYAKTFERKKMFDAMIPELDIYTQSLTPTNLTPRGLEMDRKLKTFVNEYLNTKKGRKVNFSGAVPQNGPIDMSLRMGNTVVSLIDLGASFIAQSAAFVGESIATYQSLGKIGLARATKRRIWDTGLKRLSDPKAGDILKQAEPFIGRNLWTELGEVDTPLMERGMKTIFGGFSQSTVESNKLYLLASLTKDELKAGKISAARMAELRLAAGRWRDLGRDMKSIYGATSPGEVVTKYKGWAIPIMRTNSKNIQTLISTLRKGDVKKAIKSRELMETYRMMELSAAVIITGLYVVGAEDDDSFAGKLKARAYMEANTLLSGIDPTTFVSAPRLLSFLEQLAGNLKALATLETYNTTTQWGEEGDLKGLRGLQRQLTPATIKQFQKPKTATGDDEIEAALKEQQTQDTEREQYLTDLMTELEAMEPAQHRDRLLQENEETINAVVDIIDKQSEPELSNEDKAIMKLRVENGARANLVFKKLEAKEPQERRTYLLDLLERGVISENVLEQVIELVENNAIIE